MNSEMECKELFARLSDYIDGTLEETHCVEFRRHIEDCDRCVAFVAGLKKTVDLSKELPTPPIPADFRRHLKKVLQNHDSKSSK